MIISKTPLRLSLAGGGTDLPEYYSKYGCHLITSAINKHIYIFIKKWFEPAIRVSYSKTEIVNDFKKIKHPFIRESLNYFKLNSNVEISIMADLPAGTGMGSSGSFAVGFLNALSTYKNKKLNEQNLAELAFKLQHDVLNESGGKQDQYAAAYGGIISMTIAKSGKVKVEKLKIKTNTINELENRLICFYTGKKRSASKLQKEYCKNITNEKQKVIESLHDIQKITKPMISYLKSGNVDEIGTLFAQHWNAKKNISDKISNPNFEKFYDKAIKSGAIGGKLLGAGGGGYMLFLCKSGKKNSVKRTMNKVGLIDIPISISEGGSNTHNSLKF